MRHAAKGTGTRGHGGSGNVLERGKMNKKRFRWKNQKEGDHMEDLYRSDGYIKGLKQMGLSRLHFSRSGQG